MLFNSAQFLIFFPIVVTAFFAIPHRLRWILLLGASYYFYMAWEPVYAILIVLSTLLDFVVGRKMASTDSRRKRLIYLMCSLVGNLGMLFFFKYFNFFANSLNAAFQLTSLPIALPESKFLLPIGISFYTFQTLSYTIEIYKGTLEPEKHLGKFALYVAFFPQLVAGPIERAHNLLPQFNLVQKFDYARVTNGLKLIAWGMFKKVVIADRLGDLVDMVFSDVHRYHGPSIYVGAIFFTIQIYCDFSGYSDIAIGTAEVMGFKLMQNFRRPFFSKSISEFWRRWHISLSTWFRDYVYYPLGGNRVSLSSWYFNMFIVFLLSGLWHGANWTFAVWGAVHGFYVLFSYWLDKPRRFIFKLLQLEKNPGLLKFVQVVFTFHQFAISMIIFRCKTITEAFYALGQLTIGWSRLFDINTLLEILAGFGITKSDFAIDILLIVFLFWVQMIQRHGSVRERLAGKPAYVRWLAYYGLILAILLLGVFNNNQFIYFQF